jgi:M-phase inducer tyrosine phosphatase
VLDLSNYHLALERYLLPRLFDLFLINLSSTMSDSFLKRLTDYHSNKLPKRAQFQSSTTVSRDMTFLSTLSSASASMQYLHAPPALSRKRSQMLNPKRDDIDDFLSSDLELSFASTMSLNSPPRDSMTLAQDHDIPMDVSPAYRPVQKENEKTNKPTTRPRASTSAARIFGQDMSNGNVSNDSVSTKTGSQANSKRTQRTALPMEWMASSKPLRTSQTMDGNMFAPVSDPFGLDRQAYYLHDCTGSRRVYLFL